MGKKSKKKEKEDYSSQSTITTMVNMKPNNPQYDIINSVLSWNYQKHVPSHICSKVETELFKSQLPKTQLTTI